MSSSEKRDGHSVFESKIAIRPSDIDYNGHVHHSHYLDFLLAAREDQMKRCYKVPMDDFVERGYSWMVRRYDIEYKRGLTLGDTALVKTWVVAMGDPGRNRRAQSIATIGFAIHSASSGKVAAQGTATYVMVDINNGRAVKIPDDIVEKYSI